MYTTVSLLFPRKLCRLAPIFHRFSVWMDSSQQRRTEITHIPSPPVERHNPHRLESRQEGVSFAVGVWLDITARHWLHCAGRIYEWIRYTGNTGSVEIFFIILASCITKGALKCILEPVMYFPVFPIRVDILTSSEACACLTYSTMRAKNGSFEKPKQQISVAPNSSYYAVWRCLVALLLLLLVLWEFRVVVVAFAIITKQLILF